MKAALRQHIKDATHTLVVIGQYANSPHKDSAKIGERNWQLWEIKESLAAGNKMVAVKIKREYDSPTPLLGVKAAWALSFTVDSIIDAIDSAYSYSSSACWFCNCSTRRPLAERADPASRREGPAPTSPHHRH